MPSQSCSAWKQLFRQLCWQEPVTVCPRSITTAWNKFPISPAVEQVFSSGGYHCSQTLKGLHLVSQTLERNAPCAVSRPSPCTSSSSEPFHSAVLLLLLPDMIKELPGSHQEQQQHLWFWLSCSAVKISWSKSVALSCQNYDLCSGTVWRCEETSFIDLCYHIHEYSMSEAAGTVKMSINRSPGALKSFLKQC